MNRALLLIFIHLTCTSLTFAQSDTSSLVKKAELYFNTSIKQQSRLYNGPAFKGYESNVDGSANFQDLNTFSTGSVVYQDFRFDNVPLMYNLHEDKVISLIGQYTMYSLVSEKVSEFYLNGHHFKYINVNDTVNSIIKTGFFDFIFEGQSKIFAKRKKSMQFTIKDKSMRYYFVPKTTYYLERNHEYYVINGQKSFFSYFKDKKTELKKRLKENKIKFRKQPEEAMFLLASYYESLPH